MDGGKGICVGGTLLSPSDTSDGFSRRRGLPKFTMRARTIMSNIKVRTWKIRSDWNR
jgi:hypothetical protein